ncbi:putative amidoligase enzyme-domain-containing protein [Apodospora peruviana]|uniref:Amidoligase enzyme-domain-containing protein n=1 Tax=Apodospora peruviana TaxID=516989 RepID=A0AAE0IRS5_9PEZI|nr:putative amidoligase enzyme-domain-containing protein [Apodospora peruviana]
MPHQEPHHHRDRRDHGHHHRHQSSVPEFRFSVEIAVLVRSRRFEHKTVEALQEEVGHRLALAGVLNYHIASGLKSENFKDWTIASSLSVQSRPREHKYGIKLVSPYMPFAWFDVWKAQIRAVLHVLNNDFETTTQHQCGTSIHIVPMAGYWHLSQAKALAKSAVYFESCLDRLMPLYRRKSVMAKSNRWNPYFGGLSPAQCLEKIEAQPSFQALAARMNWCAKESATGIALRKKDDFQHDGFRWNFINVGVLNGHSPIEYRQPPGVTESSDMIAWISLVVCFAQMSVANADTLKGTRTAQLSKLAEMIYDQAKRANVPRASLIKGLVEQADPPPAGAKHDRMVLAWPDQTNITIDDDQRLRWREKEPSIARDKYWNLVKDRTPTEPAARLRW